LKVFHSAGSNRPDVLWEGVASAIPHIIPLWDADRDAVRALYARLTNDGVDAWLDKEKSCGERSRTILPGQGFDSPFGRNPARLGIGNPQDDALTQGGRLFLAV
jgi:hypothetical protein